jgi:hypothetical protein
MVQVEKRYSQQLHGARVVHAGVLARQHERRRRGREPVPGARRSESRSQRGPTNFDRRHNLVVSGMATRAADRRADVWWVARALSGSPLTIFDQTVDADRNGTLADPLPAGEYSPAAGTNAITVDNPTADATAPTAPASSSWTCGSATRSISATAHARPLRRDLQRDRTVANFANPTGDQARRTSCASPGCRRARIRAWGSSASASGSEIRAACDGATCCVPGP